MESTEGQLHLKTLLGYSPELNPDELVWNWLKKKKLAKYTFHNLQELYQAVLSKLRSLQQLPEKIIDFFFSRNTYVTLYYPDRCHQELQLAIALLLTF
jgi:hypothetical protein